MFISCLYLVLTYLHVNHDICMSQLTKEYTDRCQNEYAPTQLKVAITTQVKVSLYLRGRTSTTQVEIAFTWQVKLSLAGKA